MAEIIVKGKPWRYESTDYYALDGDILNVDDAPYLLVTLKSVLEENNIIFMPMYGTLLGIVRDNNFINNDHDMDALIMGCDRQKLIDLIPELDELGIKFVRCSEPWVYTFQYRNAYCDVDVMIEARWPYNYRYCLLEKQYIPKSYFLKVKKIQFLNEFFSVPFESESLLAYFYGTNWRIPGGGQARIQSRLLVHIVVWNFVLRCLNYIKRHWSFR